MNQRKLIEDLCDLEVPNRIKISPSGKQVVYSTQLTWGHHKGKYPVSTLWLAAIDEGGSSRKITSGLFNGWAPAWHSDGHSIAFISDRAKPGKQWAIYLQDIALSKEARPITPIEHESVITSFAFSPNETSIAFISADEKSAEEKRREEEGDDVLVWGKHWRPARLRIVDIQSGSIHSLKYDRHIASFCWSPDGDKLAFASCKTSDLEEPFLTGTTISIVDIASLSQVKDVCHFPKKIDDLIWAKDDKIYFYSGYPAGTMFHGFAAYSVDAQSQPPHFEKVAFGTESDICGLSLLNGDIIVKLQHRLESRVSLLSGKSLYRKKEELEAFDAAYLPDSKETILVVASSSVNSPAEVYATFANSDDMLQLSNHGAHFKDSTFGHCSFLPFVSSDGTTEVDSMFLLPIKQMKNSDQLVKPEKPLPTLVLIHGGPNTRLTNAFNTYYYMLAPFLLSLGYGILLPNYRGSSGRGKKFGNFAIGGTDTLEYEDVISATQNAIEKGFADKDRLIVGGWSHGGLLTLHCSIRNGLHGYGWNFKASIPGASICDVDAMAITSDFGSVYKPEIQQGRVIWNMQLNDTRNRSASPIWAFKEAVDRSKQMQEMTIPPMLILHGQDDARCHISNAWALRRALESHDLPFELVIYPRQGHMFSEQKAWIDMALRIQTWCQKYIGEGDL